MRTKIALLTVLCLLPFSGCIGGDKTEPAAATSSETGSDTASATDPATSSSSASSVPPSGSSSAPPTSVSPPPGGNAAPVAELAASLVEGPAPLAVTFSIGGSDADADPLTWELDLDGDGAADAQGDEVPATVDQVYETAGTVIVTLSVSDGLDAGQASITLNILAPPPAAAHVLYFVGDGSDTTLTDPASAQPDPADPFVTSYGLSSAGNGAMETIYSSIGRWNSAANDNEWIPTFVGSEPVVLTGAPITLYVYAALTMPPLACAQLEATIFDLDGNIIGTPDGAVVVIDVPDSTTGVQEFIMEFPTPVAGEYAGLKVQASGRWSDCNAGKHEFHWGTDTYNGRLDLGDGKVLPAPA